jgi:hypothetical protein
MHLRKTLKVLAWIGGIAVVMAGVGYGGLQLTLAHFYPDPPAKDYPKPQSALEAQRQDLDYFKKLMALDRSYSPAARAEASRRVAQIEAASTPLSPQAFMVQLMRISALADNGHTHVRLLGPGRVPNLVPVRVTRFAEGLYVMRAKTPYKDMLGGRVESIDGVSFDEIVKRLDALRGGLPAFRRDSWPLFIMVQDILYGAGISKERMHAAWTVRLPSGALVTHPLDAYPMPAKGDEPEYGYRWMSPEPVKSMGEGWASYAPAEGTAPQSKHNPDRVFENLAIPGSCGRYLRLQDIDDTDGQEIAPFLNQTEAEFTAHHPCAVIVDLRGNGGGNYTKAWRFAHALPGLTGHIYILTDAGTFSAAITTAAFLKETGGGKVTMLGEPIGDRLAFYAEGSEGCLPNSKLCITYATGKHVYDGPCTDWNDCFWVNWFYPVRVNSLAPDEFIPSRFADWNAGRDVAYERAVALIGKTGSPVP